MGLDNNGYIGLEDLSKESRVTEKELGGHLEAFEGYLDIPHVARAASPGTLSNISVDDSGQLYFGSRLSFDVPRPESPASRSRGKWGAIWYRNRGLVFMILSQVFNCSMMVATRLLEIEGNDGKGYHPLQILFVRMSITLVLGSLYMWAKKVPGFPFGYKGVRLLLLARGIGGFFGVFSMYFAIVYLPIADVTVMGFLAPPFACAACAYLLKEPFTRMEQIAAFMSMIGVVLIARPDAVFTYFQTTTAPPLATVSVDMAPPLNTTTHVSDASSYVDVTREQQLIAVAVVMIGVVGGSVVITTLRWVGKRAHPLITVNVFANVVVLFSGVASALIPGIGFALPVNLKDWGYLAFLSICGFVAQTFAAAGLAHEKSSRATNMIYTQMLFALIADKVMFGHNPELLSMAGSSLILSSAIYVAVMKVGPIAPSEETEDGQNEDEEMGLVQNMDGSDDEVGDIREESSKSTKALGV